MTADTENLVLEILRQMRSDMTTMRTEMRDGFNLLDIRLGLVEQALAGIMGASASDRDEIRVLRQCIERIEWRLELQDGLAFKTATSGCGHIEASLSLP